MCNGVYDCPDKTDETDEMCSHMTKNSTCKRWFYPDRSIKFPYRWVKDNVNDCIDGFDENEANWLICKFSKDRLETKRERLEGKSCQNVMICPEKKYRSYVEFEELCDGLESCGTGIENNVCQIARDFPAIKTMVNSSDYPAMHLCQSLINEGDSAMSCHFQIFEGHGTDVSIFGAIKKEIWLPVPNSKVKCANLYGEYYVYLSCMDLCSDAKCPLDYKPLMHDSCPGQFLDRLFTLADESYLTFVRKSGNRYYHQNYFHCKNGRCVDYKQVCDLIDDCGDLSDEADCANHLICNDTKYDGTKKQLISIEQKCDGIYDCFDLSDECNNMCGKEILGHRPIKFLCWFMGFFAVLFNTGSIARELLTMSHGKTENMLITKAMVIVIASGDFLIGIYLIVLSIYDSIVFGRYFCKKQADWLTGKTCAFLGVISTLGSQLSLFAMTLLSMKRAYGLVFTDMILPSHLNKRAVLKVIFFVVGVFASSLAIALFPLLPVMEDFYVQGMHYDSNYKVFIGFPNKERHLKILSEYYKNASTQEKITTDMTWKEIGVKVDNMFTQDHGSLHRAPVHFYGNDGVCLFKYFVRTDDARRSRQVAENASDITESKGDSIVWLMLGINFMCFIFVAVAYAMINIKTQRSSEESGAYKNPATQQENLALQRKVAFLIATDFLCWVPFIVISGLHNLKFIDATSWYVSFAMTVLPLNSVLNPLIYDNDLRFSILKKVRKLGTIFTDSRLSASMQKRWETDDTVVQTATMEAQSLGKNLVKDRLDGGESQIKEVCGGEEDDEHNSKN